MALGAPRAILYSSQEPCLRRHPSMAHSWPWALQTVMWLVHDTTGIRMWLHLQLRSHLIFSNSNLSSECKKKWRLRWNPWGKRGQGCEPWYHARGKQIPYGTWDRERTHDDEHAWDDRGRERRQQRKVGAVGAGPKRMAWFQVWTEEWWKWCCSSELFFGNKTFAIPYFCKKFHNGNRADK